MRLSTINRKPAAVTLAVVGVTAITATVVVTLSTSEPSKAPGYSVSDCEPDALEVDGETWGGGVVSVSPSGEYLLGDGDAMLWGPEGKTVRISETVKKKLDSDGAVEPLEVNSQGVVIGQARKNGDPVGWKYADGEVTELTLPGEVKAEGVYPVSINEDDEVAGTASKGDDSTVLKWEPGESEATVVEDPKDAEIGATELTDDGTIVGTGRFGDETAMRVWKWDADGNREKLPFPSGVRGGFEAVEVAGDWVMAELDGAQIYRWKMTEADKPEESRLYYATDIDSRGRLFGSNDKSLPAVETESGVEELPVPEDAPAEKFDASTVGAHSGVVAGNGETKDGDTAVAWQCAGS